MSDNEPVIGIDLGTTNSVVAHVQDSVATVIKGRSGSTLLPSVVAWARSGKMLVGNIAKRQAITNAVDTVFASKRLIGRKFSSEQVQEALKSLPYVIQPGEHDDVRIVLGEKLYALPELSALILKELKLDAEAFFNRPVKKAVITVPAYFNDGQRQATKDAGKIAGLEVLRIINEPTAAALAYGFGKAVTGKVAVFDLGGGTFDVSVLEIGNGVFDVLATGGDTYLGGEDFDARIIEWLVFDFAKEHGFDLRKDRMALQRLKDSAEKAKIELSLTQEVQINLPFICSPPGGGAALHLQRSLSRTKFDEITADLVAKTITIAERVLSEAKVKVSDLKEMLLVGGMTRVPKVQEAVKAYFRRDPSKGVHPDEVVALGAAVQAQALCHSETTNVVLLDVTPQSLGVAVAGGYVRRLVPKNTTVPTSTTEVFNTSKDHQTTVKIMVLQGEDELAHKNELLGEFVMTGLRNASRGEVEIDVAFDINAEGIVSVSAIDRETGQRQSIQVTASGGLTENELKQILEDQSDQLMEVKSSDELKSKISLLQTQLDELTAGINKIESGTGDSEFGKEAAAKARRIMSESNLALGSNRLSTISDAVDAATRMNTLLKGILQRMGQ